MRPRVRLVGAFTAIAAIAVLAGACGSSSSSSSSPSSQASLPGSDLKVGLVTDIGGLNDHGFNHLAYVGLQRAASQLGVQVKVEQSTAGSDYVPNLTAFGAQHYDLVVAVGYLMDSAIKTVAPQFPDTKFAIIDDAPSPSPANTAGLLFKEQESGYDAGYLAALMSKTHVISSVGGMKSAPVDHYIAGYQAGAKAADPSVKTLNDYANSFTDNAKCKSLALNQIAQGSDVVFQVAGTCGLGSLSAVKEKNVWGVGVDADQASLGSFILTSAIKKVDVAVYDTVQSVIDGSFTGGGVVTYDATKGATGLGSISSQVPADVLAKVQQVEADVKSGKIVPPDKVP